MTDAALHLPAAFLHEAFSNRSGVPPSHFELYYCGKRLEGDAALWSWGVGKDSTIEVKMRGRGGGDGGDGVDGADSSAGNSGDAGGDSGAGVGGGGGAEVELVGVVDNANGGVGLPAAVLGSETEAETETEAVEEVAENPAAAVAALAANGSVRGGEAGGGDGGGGETTKQPESGNKVLVADEPRPRPPVQPVAEAPVQEAFTQGAAATAATEVAGATVLAETAVSTEAVKAAQAEATEAQKVSTAPWSFLCTAHCAYSPRPAARALHTRSAVCSATRCASRLACTG
eukprot:scaffold103705_cov62-Phaeocystis_antarctica.AAC.3